MHNLKHKYFSEFAGTALIVLVGCGAMTIEELSGNVGAVLVSICFGLSVTVSILLFSKISGAHFNPAVSFVMAIRQKISFKDMWLYIAAQCSGALTAAMILRLIFIQSDFLGATIPRTPDAFVMELGASMFLMLVISFSDKSPFAPFFIGFAVFLDAYYVGPFTGASMNPARTLGPAIVSGHYKGLWIYIFAPVVGMWGASEIVLYFRKQMSELKSKMPQNPPENKTKKKR